MNNGSGHTIGAVSGTGTANVMTAMGNLQIGAFQGLAPVVSPTGAVVIPREQYSSAIGYAWNTETSTTQRASVSGNAKQSVSTGEGGSSHNSVSGNTDIGGFLGLFKVGQVGGEHGSSSSWTNSTTTERGGNVVGEGEMTQATGGVLFAYNSGRTGSATTILPNGMTIHSEANPTAMLRNLQDAHLESLKLNSRTVEVGCDWAMKVGESASKSATQNSFPIPIKSALDASSAVAEGATKLMGGNSTGNGSLIGTGGYCGSSAGRSRMFPTQ